MFVLDLRKWAIALIIAAVALVAGCGGSDDAGTASADNENGAPSEQEARWADHTLIVAAPSTPSTLNGDFMSDRVDFTAHWNLYDQLVGWGQEGSDPIKSRLDEMVPRTATDWTVSDDGTVYEFKLPTDVKGLNAQTVKDQWDHAYEREGVGRLIFTVSNLAGPDAVEVVDDSTVRFTLDAPSAIFLRALTIHTAGVQNWPKIESEADSSDAHASEWLAQNAAGFGPYQVERFESGTEIVFTANPDYWDEEPYFTRVIYRAVPSAADRVALLRRGAVDIAEGLSPRDYEELRKDPAVQVLNTEGLSGVSLRFNTNIAPFDDKLVREAIAAAIPTDRVIDEVYYGNAREMLSVFPDQLPGYQPIWDIEYDPDRARQLLEEAGAEDLSIEFNYSAAVPQMENLAVIVQEALAEVGISVKLSPTPAQAYTDGLFEHRFGFFADTDMPLVPDAGYTLFLWFGESPINYTGYSNPVVSQAIEKAFKLDEGEERDKIVDQAMRTVLDDVAWVPLAFVNSEMATAAGLTGHTWYPLDVMRWSDLRPASDDK